MNFSVTKSNVLISPAKKLVKHYVDVDYKVTCYFLSKVNEQSLVLFISH